MAGYNRTRYVEQLLERTEFLPPSFTVHLHSEYWVLNNGSKFLYNNQIASLLDDIRSHRIPVDFLELFDSARVPFYEGCMIVELLDYRPQKSSEPALKNPDKTRVVLHPSPETLWADICSLNQRNGGRWTDMNALEIEAKLLLATSPPLCLDPDPHLTRIVNNVLRASTPSMPLSLKRKSSAMEPEEDGPEKAKRERLLGFMAPRDNKLHAPSYRLLDAIEMNKQKKEANKTSVVNQQYMPAIAQSVQPVPLPQAQPTSAPQPMLSAPAAAQSPQEPDEISAPTIETPQTFNVPLQPNGSQTPAPQSTQYVQPPATTLRPNMIQPQVYANLQAAQEEAIKRASTPAQPQQAYLHYMQYPYPQPLQQQQSNQTPAQPQLPRPPSQPQPLQSPQPPTQPNPPLPSPQPPTQQLNPQHGPQPYPQTPKPPQGQPTTIQPAQTQQQQPNLLASPYQGVLPNPHFSQPAASAVRPPQRPPQGQPSSIQHPQLTLSNNANLPQSQHIYPSQVQQPSQPTVQQQKQLYLQTMSQPAAATGRKTPAQTQQSPRVQPQTMQPSRAITSTPSPVKGSPVVQHSVGTPIQPRTSPMHTKAQIPIQPSATGQPLPAIGQQSQAAQQAQQPNAQQMNPGGIQMQPQTYQFQNQYAHSQLRPLVHGNQMIGGTGTPTMVHASPVLGGRPLTPADGKPQQARSNQTQQQPIRRPTPLQQQQPVLTQIPHLVKQQTPQLQAQQLPQPQQNHAQGQQIQGQAQPSPQVQQANLAAQQQQLQHQQMNTYAQMYGFPAYWRVPHQQQPQQPVQGQVGSATAATGLQLTPQLAMSTQQNAYYKQHMGLLVNQIQSAGHGQRMTPQQIQMYAHNTLMKAAQTQPVGQVGGQQIQGGQSVQQPSQQLPQPQQHQMNNAQLQATMMGKLQMGSQIHMQQGHVQGVVGGQMHMPHLQQTQGQHHSPIPQVQHVVQQKAKPPGAKKGGR